MALERLNRPTVYESVSHTSSRLIQLTCISLLLVCSFSLALPVVQRPDSLMNVQQLQRLMTSDSDWLLIDVRPRVQYLLGHIPGAHNLWRPAYEADAGEYPVKGMRASQKKMAQLLSRLGATSDTTIVLYDEHNNADSARLWWILSLYGHNNALLLDGGLMAWKKAGLHTSLKAPGTPPASQYIFNKQHERPELLANLENVKSALINQDVIILDVRSEEETTGQYRKSGALRKGRIPDSVWMEYTATMDEDGFLSKPKLKALLKEKGIKPEQTVIVYCQSGVRSANAVFVLKELMNYPDVRNYDGSWVEWSSIKALPIITGPVK